MTMPVNQILCGDALESLRHMPEGSVDLVLTDPPYGITQSDWDIAPNLTKWWSLVWNVSDHAIMHCCMPFTARLVCSSLDEYKWKWVWVKSKASGHLNCNNRPMRNTEDICVFSKGAAPYFPQGLRDGTDCNSRPAKNQSRNQDATYGQERYRPAEIAPHSNWPKELIYFANPSGKGHSHSNTKPIALMQFLILSHTNPADLILDPFCGSGTTCVAAKMLGRNYLGIDISEAYCAIARARLAAIDTGVPVAEAKAGQLPLFRMENL